MVRAARRTAGLPCISSHGLSRISCEITPGCRLAHSAAISPPVECPISATVGGASASGCSAAMMPIAAVISAS